MQNIEIKYRLADRQGILAVLRQTPLTEFVFRRRQTDHYFDVESGRYKLRVEEHVQPQLIRYQRADTKEARISDYSLEPVTDVDQTIARLEKEFGLLVTVHKVRQLYLYKNVRIHLDEVKSLGEFVELESVIKADVDAVLARQNFDHVLSLIYPFLGEVQSRSYQNLVQERMASSETD